MKVTFFRVCAVAAATVMFASCAGRNAGQERRSTVSVSGTGTVSVAPDMIRMSVSMSKTAPTTRSAQETVSKTTARVLEILKEADIDDKSIGTASLRFYPEYEWRKSGQVLLGQRAEQSVTFSVDGIADSPEKAPRIIDRLTQINGILLNEMNFDVKDRSEHFARSRELAFQKAVQKAEHYAALSGRKVTGVRSISEGGTQHVLPAGARRLFDNVMKEEMQSADAAPTTILPSGEMEITTTISAVFILE